MEAFSSFKSNATGRGRKRELLIYNQMLPTAGVQMLVGEHHNKRYTKRLWVTSAVITIRQRSKQARCVREINGSALIGTYLALQPTLTGCLPPGAISTSLSSVLTAGS